MRIGIVCYPTFGGSGVVATELGVELSKRGHNAHFLTYEKVQIKLSMFMFRMFLLRALMTRDQMSLFGLTLLFNLQLQTV